MSTSEETMLKEYYHSLSVEAEDIAELKLNAAIRGGIARSRKVTLPLRARYVLGAVAVLGILLLFTFPWAGEALKPRSAAPDQLSILQNKGEFEAYRVKASSNTTVSSAIEAGLIQRISGATAEQNGFVLTVDGIAADQRGIIILYSLQNNTGQRAAVNLLQLTGSVINPLHTSRAADIASVPTGISLGYEVLQWDEEFGSLPDQITLEMKLGEYKQLSAAAEDSLLAKLSVPIPLDRDQIAKAGEAINIDKTLTIDGQEININEVYLSASGIYLNYTFNPQNSKQIFSMFNPHFLIGSDGDYSNLDLRRTMVADGKNSMVFANNSRSVQSLQLQFDGILALDKDATELIIDTEKQEIIKSPDKNLSMSLYSTEKGATMILEYYSSQGERKIYNTFMVDSEFTDGTGKVHSTDQFNISIPPRKDLREIKVLEYLGLGSNEYSQPLTFTITDYPNLIKEKMSLTIRK